ncbi:MAG: glycosyltransferase [Bryobacteraceae bacterium]
MPPVGPSSAQPQFPSASARPTATAGDALADCRGKRIGVLVVAYNAVATLTKVLARITPEVWDNVEEVVVSDDASQDATYELAVGCKTLSEIPKLQVIRNPRNLGYGGNQKAGYRYFLERGFDVVVLLHGDGQYAPEVLSHLYHPIVAGEADAVFGSRMMPEYGGPLKGGMPLYKYVGNKILTWLENRALGMRLTEFHSGYRAYSLDALRQIDLSRMTDTFHFDTQIIVKLQHQGLRVREVPIPTYYGGEICYVNGFRYAWDVLETVYRYRRTLQSARCYPEFAEYFVHYPPKQSPYSSHYYFERLTGKNHDVLDCGCGEGFFAAELAENGNRVVGIDRLARPEHEAAFERYIEADLGRGLADAFLQLEKRTFDKVLLMDVLEHLPDPGRLLGDCRGVLRRGGRLLVSVPNVANITVRLKLLLGSFRYADRGILDRTHLRFFTVRTARGLLEENGYRILGRKTTVMPIELALGLAQRNRLARFLTHLLAAATAILPGLLGYQFVFIAAPEEPAG